ncbi:MAG: anaerobic ribonucleoside-triphosphate reductase activating protein [Ruminococcaceae bacterium]|nr:anaerobic ribonucleoside-triphosphate reductase activating protein [Oscillospiraceae bacterium]
MRISGIQKLTLLDFPGKTACTVFCYGCNFLCPFCHNALLVTEKAEEFIDEEEIFTFLKKRQGILDGVCVTGGEPTLQKDLKAFLGRIKEMGFDVKLDTNGYRPDILREIISEGLCDYVAMDIKNTPEKYALTVGKEIDTDKILESIAILKAGKIPFEFRTTVVRELHTEEDIREIARLLEGEAPFFLQQFKDSGCLIGEGLSAYNKEEMESLTEKARELLPRTSLRES